MFMTVKGIQHHGELILLTPRELENMKRITISFPCMFSKCRRQRAGAERTIDNCTNHRAYVYISASLYSAWRSFAKVRFLELIAQIIPVTRAQVPTTFLRLFVSSQNALIFFSRQGYF